MRLDTWGEKARVIVLTNLDEEQMKHKLEPLHIIKYLLKVDNTLEQIAKTVGEILR